MPDLRDPLAFTAFPAARAEPGWAVATDVGADLTGAVDGSRGVAGHARRCRPTGAGLARGHASAVRMRPSQASPWALAGS